jgi:hypothetical protein
MPLLAPGGGQFQELLAGGEPQRSTRDGELQETRRLRLSYTVSSCPGSLLADVTCRSITGVAAGPIEVRSAGWSGLDLLISRSSPSDPNSDIAITAIKTQY